MKKFGKVILLILIFSLTANLFSEEKKNNEEDKTLTEQILADARRFEIITFGALPFVTMDYSLVYSFYHVNIKKDAKEVGVEKVSPFLALNSVDISSKDLSFAEKSDIFWKSSTGQVIIGSVISSAVVGLADLGIRIARRNIKTSRRLKNAQKNIVISDLENDPDATRLPDYHNQDDIEDEVIVIEE